MLRRNYGRPRALRLALALLLLAGGQVTARALAEDEPDPEGAAPAPAGASAPAPAPAAALGTPSSESGGTAAAPAPAPTPAAGSRPWLDPSLPLDKRLDALLAALTPEQKLAQLQTEALGGVPELGLPPFSWQSDCGHGLKIGKSGTSVPVGTFGGATIYPQNLNWAATFDDALALQAGEQISDEVRASWAASRADSGGNVSFTHCMSPHVTVVRDPRWGRQVETYGEDPMLSARMAAAFVRGLQGPPDASYVKVGATCKHWLGHVLEGWRDERGARTSAHTANAELSERDLRDTFLPPFEACAREAVAVMSAYNAFDGVPCSASEPLLQGLLRGRLGFQGLVVTDKFALDTAIKPKPDGLGWAGGDLRNMTAQAVAAGTDLVMKNTSAVRPQDLSPVQLDTAARRVLRARLRMGHLDPPERLPWAAAGLNASALGDARHAATAQRLAVESLVLLKNEEGTLPLRPERLKRLAVVGPFGNASELILGTYVGATSGPVASPLEALQAALPAGVEVSWDGDTAERYSAKGAKKDAKRCKEADACVLFLGNRLSKMQAADYADLPDDAYLTVDEGEGRDRPSLLLQPLQDKLWREVAKAAAGKPLVVVLFHGGPPDISDLLASQAVGAILSAGMPGQYGAAAIADVLLGRAAPSGRLPVTWFKDSYVEQVRMTDPRMRAAADFPGRTYRYWRGEAPLFPFGFGLSYTTFALTNASVEAAFEAAAGSTGHGSGGGAGSGSGSSGSASGSSAGDPLAVEASITVANTGAMAADTSVLLFLSYVGPDLWDGHGGWNSSSSSSSSGSGGSSSGDGSGGGNSTAAADAAAIEDLEDLPSAVLSPSGCSWNSSQTDLVQRLAAYARTGELAPGASKQLTFRLTLLGSAAGAGSGGGGGSSSVGGGSGGWGSWAGFGDPEPPCGAYALRFGADQPPAAILILD